MSRKAWVLAWLFVALMLTGFWMYGLFDLDEGIYAAATAEMLRKGNWILITLRDQPFYEKPILIYWAALALLKAGFSGEFALRLPSVLATAGTLVMVAKFGRKWMGDVAAFWAVLMLASSGIFMMLGRMFTPDAMLIFFMTAALFSFWESLQGREWMRLCTALSLGLATLDKGPMPVAIFIVLLIYVVWRMPELRPNLRRFWLLGTVIFAAVVATWYVPVAVESPDFFREFIVGQNLGRLGGKDTAHLGPFWLYIPVILVGMAPFSFLVYRAAKTPATPLRAFLWAWVAAVFVLFSAAGSKLPHYVLPLFPPFALLICSAKLEKRIRWDGIVYALVVCGGLLAAIRWLPGFEHILPPVAGAALVGALFAYMLGRQGAGVLEQAFAVAAPLAVSLVLLGAPMYWRETHLGAYKVARMARELDMPVVEYQTGSRGLKGETAHPSIQWYLGREAQTAEDPEALRSELRDQTLVISRAGRFANVDIGGRQRELVLDAGGYQLYRVSPKP
jgi:4-amino-4-deoxy-L-arabinose transferase-like glycosyltransferase